MIPKLENSPSQPQPVAIVTGANAGLGFYTTRTLAERGYKVIMACRDLKKADHARAQIEKQSGNSGLEIMELDLGSFKSVYAFAEAYHKYNNQLDLLINNAGIMVPPYQKTEDGNELQWQVNYLSHFLLTGLLIDRILQSQGSRIINLSSKAHENAGINFSDLNSEKEYCKWKAYGQSKLACLLFSMELNRKLQNRNCDTISLSAHPGISNTQLFQYVPDWFQKTIGRILTPLISHPPEQAAESILLAATAPEAQGGEYYGPGGFQGFKGPPTQVQPAAVAFNRKLAKDLWAASERMTGFSYLERH